MTTTDTNVMVSDVTFWLTKHRKCYQPPNGQLDVNDSVNKHRNHHYFNYSNCNKLASHDQMVLVLLSQYDKMSHLTKGIEVMQGVHCNRSHQRSA